MTLFILEGLTEKRQLAGSILPRPSVLSMPVPGEISRPAVEVSEPEGRVFDCQRDEPESNRHGLGSKTTHLPTAESGLKEYWQQSHYFPCKVDTTYYAGSLCAAVTDEQVNDEEQEM
ncbi:hypothetical protein [Acidithiobacillus sp.]